MSNQQVRKFTVVSVLGAISFALMIFPQFSFIPGANFLKIDFSIVPAVLALAWLGLSGAVWVLALRTLLKIILFNEGVNTYLGLPVNLAVSLIFILILAAFKTEKGGWLRAVLPALSATAAMTVVALLVNYFVAVPLYADFANFDIKKFIGLKAYLWGMVLPFNLVEGLLWSLVSYFVVLLLKPFKQIF
ncbi:ECF transporter S component [Eupransor demetentiae]|uniref:Riboflavin transporter n=1 Tax=Eupransor demetentiae TaxID=3109584 RepID=A0ABP0ES66_9LACO|nr:Riboflavin transporter FmnP (FmnP) [Lactobacillaceae bacterium LMG 33000]